MYDIERKPSSSELPTMANQGDGAKNPAIALCLSGGGFRATFFHLGVLRALRQYGLFNYIVDISAVSGGSIIAAHLVQNWEKYSQDDSSFQTAANELISFGQMDLRGRIVRRLLLGFGLARRGRLRLLQSYYGHLYNNAPLRDLRPSSDGFPRPTLHLLSTSMTTGNLCAFTADGLEIRGSEGFKKLQSNLIPIAIAVAASSAFPPLFPPVRLTREALDVTSKELSYEDYLADGGIFDNLGIERVLDPVDDRHFDAVLISDASAPFDWNVERSYRSLITRTVRSTDILMKRVTDLEERALIGAEQDGRPKIIRLSIDDIVHIDESSVALDLELQKLVGRLRTDLDEFSADEINSLAQHGYSVVDKVLRATTWQPGMDKVETEIDHLAVWGPLGNLQSDKVERHAKVLTAGRRRRWRLWNPGDWASWALLLFVVAPIASIYILGYLTSAAPRVAEIRELRSFSERRSAAVAQVAVGEAVALSVPFATLRKRADPVAPDSSFGSEVAPLTTGEVVVSIPLSHRVGEMERPVWPFEPVSEDHIVLIGDSEVSSERWFDRISAAPHQQPVTIFVPGYNSSFASGARRAAALAFDLNIEMETVLFSWPSFGQLTAYIQDLQRAELSVRGFVETVTHLGSDAEKKLNLVAESLGGLIVSRALEHLGAQGQSETLEQVVLIAPDVAPESLEAALSESKEVVKRVTIYVFPGDTSMRASNLFHRHPRAGAAFETDLPDVDVIYVNYDDNIFELTNTLTSEVLQDLRLVLQGVPIEERPTLVRQPNAKWQLRGRS